MIQCFPDRGRRWRRIKLPDIKFNIFKVLIKISQNFIEKFRKLVKNFSEKFRKIVKTYVKNLKEIFMSKLLKRMYKFSAYKIVKKLIKIHHSFY